MNNTQIVQPVRSENESQAQNYQRNPIAGQNKLSQKNWEMQLKLQQSPVALDCVER